VTTVWLPDAPEKFGPLPPGIEADVWDGGDLPDSADRVEYVVLPQRVRQPEDIARVCALPSLKTLQLLSAGAEHILPYVPSHITLCNARGAHTPATAELTAGLIIAGLRNFPRFAVAQHEGRWDTTLSDSVAGKRVLIVGYGDIGAAVERRLAGWDVTVQRVARSARKSSARAHSPSADQNSADQNSGAGDRVHAISELPTLLSEVDVVVILVPVTSETRHLVDAEFLKAMKDGAMLVNAARGVIVDTDALLAELTSGRLRAALDVTDPEPLPPGHPLWQAPGLFLTPHVGGAIREVRERGYQVVTEQLARLAAGEPLRNVIGPQGY
jgi:phosphoglycerate dehydrogenase-like enzyme